MGVTVFALVANGAHDKGLPALLIDGVAHGLAVDSQAVILRRISVIPALKSEIQVLRSNANQEISNDGNAGNHQAALLPPATETLACLGSKACAQSEMAR